MKKNISLWEVLVPCKMHDKPVRTKHHKEWDKYVRKITNGLTILKPARGQWVDDSNELHEERMIQVRVACTDKQIDKIIDFTLRHYDQLAVMAYLISTKVIIKHKNEHAKI